MILKWGPYKRHFPRSKQAFWFWTQAAFTGTFRSDLCFACHFASRKWLTSCRQLHHLSLRFEQRFPLMWITTSGRQKPQQLTTANRLSSFIYAQWIDHELTDACLFNAKQTHTQLLSGECESRSSRMLSSRRCPGQHCPTAGQRDLCQHVGQYLYAYSSITQREIIPLHHFPSDKLSYSHWCNGPT